MPFEALRNPTEAELQALLKRARLNSVRRIMDPHTGTVWCWDATLATHADGARHLGIACSKPPGSGEILVLQPVQRPARNRLFARFRSWLIDRWREASSKTSGLFL